MHESGENYLETILMIKEKKGVVRSIDVARALNFSKPSVSRAMGLLRDQGFISMEQGGDIQLTEEGLAKAKSIYARHLLLTAFLQEVTGVSEEMAEENACRRTFNRTQLRVRLYVKVIVVNAGSQHRRQLTCIGRRRYSRRQHY